MKNIFLILRTYAYLYIFVKRANISAINLNFLKNVSSYKYMSTVDP